MQEPVECRDCPRHRRNNLRFFAELAEDQGRIIQEVLCRECPGDPWQEWERLNAESSN